jgi:hypothetical protein
MLAWSQGTRQPQPQTAVDLVAELLARQQTKGFVLRAKLVTGESGSDQSAVVQVRAIGRRDATTTRILYQALWPSSLKGRAVCIQKDRGSAAKGFVFQPPDTVTPMTNDTLSAPVFESELTVEDLSEDFWNWPNPQAVGNDKVEGRPCRVIDLRPPAGTASAYSRIAGCVSPERLLPLRIEKFGKDGRLLRRFVVKKAVKAEDGTWAPVKVVVETAGRKQTTTLEVSRGEKDVTVSLAEFSVEKLKSFAAR